MNSYNGFPPAQRNRAQAWLRAEWASGRLAEPRRCCACGQTDGVIDAHAEDYSEPFGAGKTDEFHLCFTCHMMVHCRFKNLDAWDRYRAAVRAGKRFPGAQSRNFGRFRGDFLASSGRRAWPAFEQHDPPTRLPLDEIEQRSGAMAPVRPAALGREKADQMEHGR